MMQNVKWPNFIVGQAAIKTANVYRETRKSTGRNEMQEKSISFIATFFRTTTVSHHPWRSHGFSLTQFLGRDRFREKQEKRCGITQNSLIHNVTRCNRPVQPASCYHKDLLQILFLSLFFKKLWLLIFRSPVLLNVLYNKNTIVLEFFSATVINNSFNRRSSVIISIYYKYYFSVYFSKNWLLISRPPLYFHVLYNKNTIALFFHTTVRRKNEFFQRTKLTRYMFFISMTFININRPRFGDFLSIC